MSHSSHTGHFAALTPGDHAEPHLMYRLHEKGQTLFTGQGRAEAEPNSDEWWRKEARLADQLQASMEEFCVTAQAQAYTAQETNRARAALGSDPALSSAISGSCAFQKLRHWTESCRQPAMPALANEVCLHIFMRGPATHGSLFCSDGFYMFLQDPCMLNAPSRPLYAVLKHLSPPLYGVLK